MTITEARQWVRSSVRDAGGDSTVYSDELLDRAILYAGDHFCRNARCAIKTESVAITDGSNAFPITTPVSNGFRPDRIIDLWLTTEADPLTVIDYAELQRLRAVADTTGVPTKLAFLDNTAPGLLHPTPGDDYSALLRYFQPFGVTYSGSFHVGWTPGTLDATTVAGVLNVPDDLLRPTLVKGAAAVAMEPNAEKAAPMLWKQYLDHVAECAGEQNLGVRVGFRKPNPQRFSIPSRPGEMQRIVIVPGS